MDDVNLDTTISIDSFDYICRTCLCKLQENATVNINDFMVKYNENNQKNTEIAVGEVLLKCASIVINAEDSLPKNICQKCMSDLTHTYEFISKCQKSEEILHTTLTCIKNVIIETSDVSTDIDIKTENIILDRKCDLNIEHNPCKIEIEECDLSAVETVDIKTEINTIEENYINKNVEETAKLYCDHCDILFKNVDEYQQHRGNVKYCSQCPQKFVKHEYLISHLKAHTNEQSHSEFSQRTDEMLENNKSFPPRNELREHLDTVIAIKEKPGKYSCFCKICGKGFSTKSNLSVHERIHTGEKPYLCKYCGRGFVKSTHLKFHERIHTGEKPFICKFCGKTFVRNSNLCEHERIHTGNKPFVCKFCGKSFVRSGNLNEHERIHTGEKPYVCKICGKGYRLSNTLKVHERRSHTGEKPYTCNFCVMKFYGNSALMHHIKRTHNKV